MDPQQRLLAMYVWKAMEDAGYSAERISGTKTGIFVGTASSGYSGILGQAGVTIDGYYSTGNSPSIGPNRMSYFLNIHGPSEPIETSCSSSLVAIHRAINAIHNGDCDAAIVGGINTIISPEFHISFNHAGMLSQDGKCKTFSDQANGYVRGEGVGMIFLKKLTDAEEAGDHIYGVIRGSYENHGGRASSLTAPNPKAQADLLKTVYSRAGIDPKTVGYIEAHGTGTPLGDPIEVNGLKMAFEELQQMGYDEVPVRTQPYCGLGSIKTNIGHLELAAGIAGVIKVLLQLKHKTLVRNLHLDEVNPYIELEGSPFYMLNETKEWEAFQDRYGQELPRRAGVSSFGFGGVNAHVIIEEYVQQEREQTDTTSNNTNTRLIVLSAKTEERLKERARQLLNAIQAKQIIEGDLDEVAYTLQVGRDVMEVRLGFTVHSLSEFEKKLSSYVDANIQSEHIYQGVSKRGNELHTLFESDSEKEQMVDTWMKGGQYDQLLSLWVKGLSIDWDKLYVGEERPRRISLPTYPFAKERYWISNSPLQEVADDEETALWFQTSWNNQEVPVSISKKSPYATRIAWFVDLQLDTSDQEMIAKSLDGTRCIHLQHPSSNIAERFQSFASTIFEELKELYNSKASGKILLQIIVTSKAEPTFYSGLSGLLKTAQLENPKWSGQLIEIEEHMNALEIVQIVQDNSQDLNALHIRYKDGIRYKAGWSELATTDPQLDAPWKDGSVYLITGGAGGVGLLFAREIARRTSGVTLIVTGRSKLSYNKQQQFQELEQKGMHVDYQQADVTVKKDMEKLLQYIIQTHGKLSGIIHAAGLVRDNFIIKKTMGEFMEVLAPKVLGLVNLDQASQHLDLEFFALISSIASSFGNVGQADYASANGFMDAFAEWRNRKVGEHKRSGHTITINYPLWQEGGMQVDAEIQEQNRRDYGLSSMSTAEGLKAFYHGLKHGLSHLIVLTGEKEQLLQTIQVQESQASYKAVSERMFHAGQGASVGIDFDQLYRQIAEKLKLLVSETTGCDVRSIDLSSPLESYGIDSFMIPQLNMKLQMIFGELSRTLFYEYFTLGDVLEYLMTEHEQDCWVWADAQQLEADEQTCQLTAEASGSNLSEKSKRGLSSNQPVAIIGISGRYPDAENLEEYWSNLYKGRTSITEVPLSRWDWKNYTREENSRSERGKWGAFIKDFNKFDPFFFNMTPRDAENMDPQERQFLLEAWKALEDAGYSSKSLSCEVRQRTGVFGGLTKQGFQMYSMDNPEHFPVTSVASLTNRVSYYLNLQGPSVSVDTMCSSALVAIHEACEYIRKGNGRMALAGGVNLYTHPSTYLGLSKNQMLSDTVQHTAFAGGGTGFVPGEGVGVVVLKSLAEAERDGDYIYAVIQGTAVNHNGRTNGYTVPNPNQQAAVIQSALEQGKIDPRTISYIEAAASGSEMADAIEMTALTKVFGNREGVEGRYSIGSVKSLIGHSESASGMSQLAKVILSLQHQTLVPTVIRGELNPNIDFEQLPFQVQEEVSDWDPVIVDGNESPRRAGITCIGAGGVNAHIIVEEYQMDSVVPLSYEHTDSESNVFVLSAKNTERLSDYVNKWINYLEAHPNLDFERAAYTLQIGREAMNCRLAVVGESFGDILNQLKRWENSCENTDHCFTNKSRDQAAVAGRWAASEVAEVLRLRDVKNLARMWVMGAEVDWSRMYTGRAVRRLNQLPTYPFHQRLCWFTHEERSMPRASEVIEMRQKEQEDVNKATEFYSFVAKSSHREFQEEYLTFCPFEKRIEGFSVSRVFLNPEQYPMEVQMIREKQIELRQVLFCKEDFTKMRSLMDFGCGHGTDVIQIASLYPHIQTHGYTITSAQAQLGNERIAKQGLSSQATIFNRDSARDPFPGRYDTILGIEVSFHIRDKQRLFHNISTSLNDHGSVLLMDYIANLRGAIVDVNVEITIPTEQEWIDLLATNHLIIDEIIDVSQEIANFLYDPEVEQVTANMPQVVKDTYSNYANQAVSLEKGWISYCLFKLKKDVHSTNQQRKEHNAAKLASKTPYRQALSDMVRSGHIPYPIKTENLSFPSSTMQPEKPKQDLSTITRELKGIFLRILGLQTKDIEEEGTFQEWGITSIHAVELMEAINSCYSLRLPTSVVFECNTLHELAGYIADSLSDSEDCNLAYHQKVIEDQEEVNSNVFNREIVNDVAAISGKQEASFLKKQEPHDSIAIVGLSVRSAGAQNQDQFWELISQGKDCISDIDEESWHQFFQENSSKLVPTRYGAMEEIEAFDSAFFKISPKEAEAADVSQRILLEECYKALEDAGYNPSSLSDKDVGVVIGAINSMNSKQDFSHFSMLGADASILSARIAYYLNLKGPALTIHTACSSSLVAVDLAAQKLKTGEVDYAIAGGITVYTRPDLFVSMNHAGMLSPSGTCRPFDDAADGIVVGDGVGVVILKRLADAERDGDHIYGVIRGSSTNQDGQTSGITVPSFQSQSDLQQRIYKRYNIDVENIQYIEAHGTGTSLGDPIEIDALTHTFRYFTEKKQYVAVGSLKANIGHTTAAAGVLGLIKILLSIKNKQLPPMINYSRRNKHIDLDNSPFYVNTKLKEWPCNANGTRLAAINSFGFSGTNAHMVIEEYPMSPHKNAESTMDLERLGLLTLSARTEEGLRVYATRVLAYLQTNPYVELANVLYTLQTGRDSMTHRVAFVTSSLIDLIEQLQQFVDGKQSSGQTRYQGTVKSKTTMSISDTEEGREFVKRLVSNRKIRKLAELWVNGSEIDWNLLYKSGSVRKVAGLPHYPFAKLLYKINKNAPESGERYNKQRNPMERQHGPSPLKQSVGEDFRLQLTALDQLPADEVAVTPDMKPTGITLSSLSGQQDSVPVRDHSAVVASSHRLHEQLAESLADALYMKHEDVDIDQKFSDMGMDSVIGVEWVREVNKIYGTSITASKMFSYPTVRLFAEYLSSLSQADESSHQTAEKTETKLKVAMDTEVKNFEYIKKITELLAEALFMNPEDIDIDKNFIELGLDSIVGVEWIQSVNRTYHTSISATTIYDYPTIRSFASYLKRMLTKSRQNHLSPNNLSIEEMLQQVYEGKLDANKASQILLQYQSEIQEE